MLTKNQLTKTLMSICGTGNVEGSNANDNYAFLRLSLTKPTAIGSNIIAPDASTGYADVIIGAMVDSKYGVLNKMGNVEFNEATQELYISNISQIILPEATSDWGTIKYFAIYNSSSSDVPCYIGKLSEPMTITAGAVPCIRVGSLKIYFTVNELE